MRTLIVCLLCLFFIQCGEFEVLDYNKQIRKSADSLYRIQRPLFEKMGDSICNSKIELFRQTAIDTLKKSTLEEIEKLIKDQ